MVNILLGFRCSIPVAAVVVVPPFSMLLLGSTYASAIQGF